MSTLQHESKPRGSGQTVPANGQPAGLPPEAKPVLVGLLSRAEVARRLGVCPHTIQRLTRKGELRALVFNKRLIRYAPAAVEAFIESATTGKGVPQ